MYVCCVYVCVISKWCVWYVVPVGDFWCKDDIQKKVLIAVLIYSLRSCLQRVCLGPCPLLPCTLPGRTTLQAGGHSGPIGKRQWKRSTLHTAASLCYRTERLILLLPCHSCHCFFFLVQNFVCMFVIVCVVTFKYIFLWLFGLPVQFILCRLPVWVRAFGFAASSRQSIVSAYIR